jgi:hypothetical protein
MADTDDQEFEAAFKEASGESSTATPPDGANGADMDDAAAQAAAEELEDQAKAADPNRQDGAAEQPPANTDTSTPDIWADAPAHLKAAHEAAVGALEHRLKSDEGRVSSFQRKSDDLRRQLQVLRNVGEQDDLQGYLDSEEYKAKKDEYGADLGPVFKLIEGLAKNNRALTGHTETVAGNAISQVENEVERLLDEAAYDRADLLSDNRFIPWLERQPKFVRELATRNWDAVNDPAELVELCDRFANANGIERKFNPEAPANPETSQTAQPHAINRKRDLQLDGSRSMTSRQPLAQPGADEDDFDGAWKEAEAAATRKLKRA